MTTRSITDTKLLGVLATLGSHFSVAELKQALASAGIPAFSQARFWLLDGRLIRVAWRERRVGVPGRPSIVYMITPRGKKRIAAWRR
jgi:hypothetical protein